MSLIKNLVDRIETQNNKGYHINWGKSKKPIQLQQKKVEQNDPNDQNELKQQKKIEQNKHQQKNKMKTDTTVSKTIKDGRKAGTHKCIFSYTKQE